MNNKRGGAGAKIILVLILMIASAVGGAYGYRVVDGKFAVREANKIVDSVKVSDYDAPENTEIQGYIDNAKSDLETASTRKEVYEILVDFRENVSGVLTRTQKELAEKSGVRQSNISRIENGICSPTIATLEALATGMGKKLIVSFE